MSGESPVFVTGVAAYTCLGLGHRALWDHLGARGPNGKGRPQQKARWFAAPQKGGDDQRSVWSEQRLSSYLLSAIDNDLGDFLRALSPEERERCGVALGTAYGHLGSYFSFFQTGTEQGYQLVNPRHFPFTLPNCCAVSISDAYCLWGSSTTVSSGLASGLEALALAADAIRRGDEEVMLAGAADEINDFNVHVLDAVVSRSPTGAIRPLAEDRDGTVPGEGVGVVLLQSAGSATAHKMKPLAEVCGTAVSRLRGGLDEPEQVASVIGQALSDSGLELSEVEAVFPSANGSREGDELERRALRHAFGARLSQVALYPVKEATGECFAASAMLQYLAAVYCVGTAESFAGAGVDVDEDEDVGEGGRSERGIDGYSNALVFSCGYDGTIAATVLRRPPA